MRQYAIVTASYWGFTLTDGALRMLVVLYFHQLGYSPLEIAMLFIFYEVFGIVTNLFGGYLAARVGLAFTLIAGLCLQVGALGMLLIDPVLLSVPYVMLAQAISGIGKDLNKMSAKSSIKLFVPEDAQGILYRWVAGLTGSKNALKGFGFFLGGALLESLGFRSAIAVLAIGLVMVTVLSLVFVDRQMGKSSAKPKFSAIFSKSDPVNRLSAARLGLFGARDVWFVVALPVFLQEQLAWSATAVGTLLAVWIIGYGAIQMIAPRISNMGSHYPPDGLTVVLWGGALFVATTILWIVMGYATDVETLLIVGLLVFGGLFAINSAVHSYLIVSYAERDSVSLDVGFYYMSNAAGRLLGTVLSGFVYQVWGIAACILVSAVLIFASTIIAVRLPRNKQPDTGSTDV